MASPIFGEFVGTFIPILLGDGVVAGVLLKRLGAVAVWIHYLPHWGLTAVLGGLVVAVAGF